MKKSTVARALAIAGLVAMLAAGGSAAADHCNGTVTEAGPLYIDDRGLDSGNVWVYLESNGQAGLQSGGSQGVFGYSDECSHATPDTLLY
jgi:hypothetical protein